MIGSSTRDIEAARAAGVAVIAYAPDPDSARRFAAAGADAVIDSMSALGDAV